MFFCPFHTRRGTSNAVTRHCALFENKVICSSALGVQFITCIIYEAQRQNNQTTSLEKQHRVSGHRISDTKWRMSFPTIVGLSYAAEWQDSWSIKNTEAHATDYHYMASMFVAGAARSAEDKWVPGKFMAETWKRTNVCNSQFNFRWVLTIMLLLSRKLYKCCVV